VLLGRVHDRQRESGEESVVRGEQRKIDCDVLVPCGIVKAFCHPAPVGLVGHLLAHVGQVIRAGGLLDMRQQFRPCAPQRHPPPEEVARGAHLCRRARGLREQTTTEQDGDLVRIDLVVCGFATVHRRPGEGMAQPTGDTLASPKVGEPIPGEHALDSDNHLLPLGGHGLEKRLWARGQVAMQQALAVVGKTTDVHGAGMQVDATVQWGLFRGESQEVSSSCVRERFPRASIPPGDAEGGGLNKYQPAAADACQRPLRSRLQARLRRSVRHAFHRSGKEVRQQQWLLAQ